MRKEKRGGRLVQDTHVELTLIFLKLAARQDARLHRPEVSGANIVISQLGILGRIGPVGHGLKIGNNLFSGHRRLRRGGRRIHSRHLHQPVHDALIEVQPGVAFLMQEVQRRGLYRDVVQVETRVLAAELDHAL